MALSEFSIIQQYFTHEGLNFGVPGVDLGPGDDCALLSIDSSAQLAITLDVLQEGVHFPVDTVPELLAWHGLAVNLSDLAAMGAEPLCFTLGLSLPRADPVWLENFSKGLASCAGRYRCALAGGDLTRGPLSLAIQAHGLVPKGEAVLRSGAQPNDLVFVTGTLGDAAAALLVLDHFGCHVSAVHGVDGMHFTALTAAYRDCFLNAYYTPLPQIAAGMALRGRASAAIDISDGLLADLGHITAASGVGACINLPDLPLSEAMKSCVTTERALKLAAAGGDDYQLCFTVPASDSEALVAKMTELEVAVTCIGKIIEGTGVHCLDEKGRQVSVDGPGYRHFDNHDGAEGGREARGEHASERNGDRR
ncbi:MAG: thiamine-phosphate kinase [Pseudohongiellaceae bacterium]